MLISLFNSARDTQYQRAPLNEALFFWHKKTAISR